MVGGTDSCFFKIHLSDDKSGGLCSCSSYLEPHCRHISMLDLLAGSINIGILFIFISTVALSSSVLFCSAVRVDSSVFLID